MMKFNINESRRDDLLIRYMELLNSNGINANIGQVKSKLLNKFVVEGNIHNLSLRSNFYLAGVARYYFEGSLTKNSDLSLLKPETWQGQDIADTWDTVVCKKLDALINVLRNAYIDTVGTEMLEPEDLGELPLKDLFKKYSAEIRKELGGGKKRKSPVDELNTDENVGNGYTFDIMYSHNDCKKYNEATSPGAWCITYAQHHYNSYVNWLNIHYVIFRQNGWENIPRPKDPEKEPGFTPQKPHDAYGNSLIAMLQSNDSPEPVYITSRWNHGYECHCEADHAYTKEEFQKITGVTDADLKRIYDIWKALKNKKKTNTVNKKEENFISRSLKYLQMRINAGENPEKLFSEVKHVYGSTKINKGTFVCSAKISETTMGTNERSVSFIFDNGKILFNTVCTGQSALDTITNFAIIVNLSNDKHLIYSLKHHKLLSINGTYVFRRIPEFLDYFDEGELSTTEYYFEIKEGMLEIALFSTKTMEPIQLPNGQYWFNEVKCNTFHRYRNRSRIECEIYRKNNNTCFTIVYDLSSNERYFYNTTTSSFFEIPMPDTIKTAPSYYNDYKVTEESSAGFEPYLEDISYSRENVESIPSVIPVRYGKLHRYGANNNEYYYTDESSLQLFRDGKPISINNTTWFKSISVYDSFVVIDQLNNFYIIVNKDLTKYLSVEGFDFNDIDSEAENGKLKVLYKPKPHENEFLMYDTDTNSFLVSPLNSIVFTGNKSYSWGSWYNNDDGKKVHGSCFEFPDRRKVPKKWLEYGDVNDDGSFNISYNSLLTLCKKYPATWIDINTGQQVQDTVQIHANDVANMVSEAIEKILKRIISA